MLYKNTCLLDFLSENSTIRFKFISEITIRFIVFNNNNKTAFELEKLFFLQIIVIYIKNFVTSLISLITFD